MSNFLSIIKRRFRTDLPVIRIYLILYLFGVFIGVISAVLLRNDFTNQARLLFRSENTASLIAAFLQQFFFFVLLFFIGLTVVGLPLVPLFPIYKGFSLGLLIALSVILTGVRGFLFGTLAFFIQNLYYTVLGFFICYSATRLSVSLFDLLRGRGKHGVTNREFREHIGCFFLLIPFLFLGALWESDVVPIILNLF